jgi:hypothetical protein
MSLTENHRDPFLVKIMSGFSVPFPGIVFLTAGPIFPANFDSDHLKILDEKLPVILKEGVQRAGFCEIVPAAI